MIASGSHIEGFEAPMHRALAEPILLGGAPRAIAIVNGTIAAALGLAYAAVGLAEGPREARSARSRGVTETGARFC